MVDGQTQYEIGNERLLDGLIGVLLVTGLGLLALNGPFSSIRDIRIETFVLTVLPVVLAVTSYARVASTVSPLETAVLAIWGYYAIRAAGVTAYFLFGAQSASYPGALAELWNDVALFLATVALIAALYSAAAKADRSLLKWGVVAAVPLGQLVAYAVILSVVV